MHHSHVVRILGDLMIKSPVIVLPKCAQRGKAQLKLPKNPNKGEHTIAVT